MEKRKKTARFLKNRTWRSKVANRLRGRVQDVCRDYLTGAIDRLSFIRVKQETER